MNKIVHWAVVAGLLVVAVLVPGFGCQDEEEVEDRGELIFGTGVTAAEELDALSRAIVRAMRKEMPEYTIVSIENPGGTAEVIKDVARYDLCGLSLDEAAMAYYGSFAWEGQQAHPELRLLCVIGNLPVAFIVGDDSGIKSIYDLDSKPFGNGGKENVADFKVTKLLEALDIKPDWNRDSWASQVDLYKEGKLAGFLHYGVPEPVLKVAESRPFTVLGLSKSELADVGERYGGTGLAYPPCFIRPGTYPGQTDSITTCGLLLGYYTHRDVDSKITHGFIRAIWSDLSEISVCYQPLEMSVMGLPMHTLQYGPFPLHRGAVEFYESRFHEGAGLEVPTRLLPLEMR